MDSETLERSTMDEAIDYARAHGPCLVLAPETLRQIQAAEAAGGFEGGMSGDAGGAPFSAVGQAGDGANATCEAAPPEPLDLDGAWVWRLSAEGVAERILELRDLVEAWRGTPTGPILLVPLPELRRWLHPGEPDAS